MQLILVCQLSWFKHGVSRRASWLCPVMHILFRPTGSVLCLVLTYFAHSLIPVGLFISVTRLWEQTTSQTDEHHQGSPFSLRGIPLGVLIVVPVCQLTLDHCTVVFNHIVYQWLQQTIHKCLPFFTLTQEPVWSSLELSYFTVLFVQQTQSLFISHYYLPCLFIHFIQYVSEC